MKKQVTVCLTIDSDVTMKVVREQIELKTGWKVEKLFSCDGDETVDPEVLQDVQKLSSGDPQYGGIPPPDWLALNVGGKHFVVSRNTLLNCPDAETSLLSKMFRPDSGMQASARDIYGAYLIDRNPKYFETILDFIRTGNLIQKDQQFLEELVKEAQYFGIESMCVRIEEMRQRLLSTSMVTFVVSDKRFVIARKSLLSFCDAESCLLSCMVRDDPSSTYALDCSPDCLETILHFIRTGSVVLKNNLQPHVVYKEALNLKVTSLLPVLRERDQFVAFDCNGVILTTMKSTFLWCASMSKCLLCSIVEEHSDLKQACFNSTSEGTVPRSSFAMPENDKGAIVLHRDAKIFGPFLRFHEVGRFEGDHGLRNTFNPVDADFTAEVLREAQYFGVDDDRHLKAFLNYREPTSLPSSMCT